MEGFVKFFIMQKGYGFITADKGQGEYFVHYTEIQSEGFKELHEGQRVEFDPAEDAQGRDRAENVKVIIPKPGDKNSLEHQAEDFNEKMLNKEETDGKERTKTDN